LFGDNQDLLVHVKVRRDLICFFYHVTVEPNCQKTLLSWYSWTYYQKT